MINPWKMLMPGASYEEEEAQDLPLSEVAKAWRAMMPKESRPPIKSSKLPDPATPLGLKKSPPSVWTAWIPKDKTAVAKPVPKQGPEMKVNKGLGDRIADRAKEFFNNRDMFWKHMNEQTHTPNQDIVRDYLKGRLEPNNPTYIQAMKWAAEEDAKNDPMSAYRETHYADPKVFWASMLNNLISKEKNKRALGKSGIERY
jgi:hypothetical protein